MRGVLVWDFETCLSSVCACVCVCVCVCVRVYVCVYQDSQAKQNAGYSLHQLQGNKAYGTEYDGMLYKKSEGWVNIK